MNERDPDYLAALQRYFAKEHAFPSYDKLLPVLGLAARSAVKTVLERLAKQGFVERNNDGVWVPGRRFFERQLVQSDVQAGMPTDVAEMSTQPFYLDQYLIESPPDTLVIRVRGDSMTDAHIDDGDLAIVDTRRSASVGEFVVARVDGQFTLKELVIEKGRVALRAHNPAYPLILPENELDIVGVVVGLTRKLVR
jgi:repressor LexA